MVLENQHSLSRRERQVLEILYRQGRATAAEVLAALPSPPSYSAVRAVLRVLEEKGYVRHEEERLRYVYLPTVPRDKAKRSALRHLVHTFFEGSVTSAVAALLDTSARKLSDDELNRLAAMVERARKERKQ